MSAISSEMESLKTRADPESASLSSRAWVVSARRLNSGVMLLPYLENKSALQHELNTVIDMAASFSIKAHLPSRRC